MVLKGKRPPVGGRSGENLCRWRESNPHPSCPGRDFESRASANSATPARPITIREVVLIYKMPGRPKRDSAMGALPHSAVPLQEDVGNTGTRTGGTVPLRGQSPKTGDSPPRRCLSPARSDIVAACRRPKGSKKSAAFYRCASPTSASSSRA